MARSLEQKREYMRVYSAARRADPPRHARHLHLERERQLRKKYGMSWDDFLAMFAAQGGECALCGDPFKITVNVSGLSFKEVHVDHNHKTGKVRGLLCFRCNSGLGKFLDNPELLIKAVFYLEEQHG